MKILVTGADSFIGKNLTAELKNRQYKDVAEIYDCADTKLLNKFIDECDVIFHLLTLYRSEDITAFDLINAATTGNIVDIIGEKNKTLILLSSTQALSSSPYGVSKRDAEITVERWAEKTGNKARILRLANEFGKWCPPKLNSVVATFCDNVAGGREIQINNPEAPLQLIYIDDIVNGFISSMEDGCPLYKEISPVYEITVRRLAEKIKGFHADRKAGNVPDTGDELTKKLYSTYLSYLPAAGFAAALEPHTDERGSFTELLHFGGLGQVSINCSKPGVTKGNHWHHTKTERFIVVRGSGIIRFRKIGERKVIEYAVSADKPEAVDIPPGYTHQIVNTGETDMLTVIWANEIYDNEKPDTYFEEV